MIRQQIDNKVENRQGNEIQKEYSKIDGDWLILHYKITAGLVFLAFLVECVISIFIIQSDLLHTTVPRYIMKYIAIPSGINFVGILIDALVLKIKRFTQEFKIYCISLVSSIICFVLFTVHNLFNASFYLFSLAVMLTVVYANYRITLHTAATSLFLMILSELTISWDVDKESIFQSDLRMSNFFVAVFMIIAFTIICLVVIRYEQRKNLVNIRIEQERTLLEQRIKIDELTGIYNRKALYDMLKDIDDNKNSNYVLSIIDIDKFKDINDTFGHHYGDACLIDFAILLSENEIGAIPFRYAGDEFCLIFYNTDLEQVEKECEQLRLKTKQLKINDEITFTASFGIARYDENLGAAQLFVQADQALYHAKIMRDSIKTYFEKN